ILLRCTRLRRLLTANELELGLVDPGGAGWAVAVEDPEEEREQDPRRGDPDQRRPPAEPHPPQEQRAHPDRGAGPSRPPGHRCLLSLYRGPHRERAPPPR